MSSLRGVRQEEMPELFYYKEGKLFNKVRRGARALKDTEAGFPHSAGYLSVFCKGYHYKVHRVIWMVVHGVIPEHLQIDHINGDRADNRVENLRLVTSQENNFNTKHKGIDLHKPSGRWRARIGINHKRLFLGYFDTEEEARQAYLEAKQEHHIIRDRRGVFLCL